MQEMADTSKHRATDKVVIVQVAQTGFLAGMETLTRGTNGSVVEHNSVEYTAFHDNLAQKAQTKQATVPGRNAKETTITIQQHLLCRSF